MGLYLKCKITRGTQSDFLQIISLWKESVQYTHSFLREKDFKELEEEMGILYLPSMPELWLCHVANDLVAFCANNGPNVEMLFVKPGYMKKGIGRLLLNHIHKLYGPLALDVNEDNKNATAFYLRCGFYITGRSPLDNQGRKYPILHLKQYK